MKSNISKNTIAIRAALESDEQFGAVIPPVHLTTTFAFKTIWSGTTIRLHQNSESNSGCFGRGSYGA